MPGSLTLVWVSPVSNSTTRCNERKIISIVVWKIPYKPFTDIIDKHSKRGNHHISCSFTFVGRTLYIYVALVCQEWYIYITNLYKAQVRDLFSITIAIHLSNLYMKLLNSSKNMFIFHHYQNFVGESNLFVIELKLVKFFSTTFKSLFYLGELVYLIWEMFIRPAHMFYYPKHWKLLFNISVFNYPFR